MTKSYRPVATSDAIHLGQSSACPTSLGASTNASRNAAASVPKLDDSARTLSAAVLAPIAAARWARCAKAKVDKLYVCCTFGYKLREPCLSSTSASTERNNPLTKLTTGSFTELDSSLPAPLQLTRLRPEEGRPFESANRKAQPRCRSIRAHPLNSEPPGKESFVTKSFNWVQLRRFS